jgi:GR25 family glycosyltransferase involved in LPS biosynthesis
MAPRSAAPVRSTRKIFKNAYAISLNRNNPRYRKTIKTARAAGVNIKYSPGVIVTDEMLKKGISGIPYKSHDNMRGIIGCFLAQRNLLEKIAKNHPKGANAPEGTLILEDDVVFPKTFKNDLERIYPEVPDDWDVLFLGRTITSGKKIGKHLIKFGPRTHKNWGNWAYIVRHKTMKKKLMPRLKVMTDGIDVQFNRFSDKANMYVIQPNIVNYNNLTHSNIKNTNKIQAV